MQVVEIGLALTVNGIDVVFFFKGRTMAGAKLLYGNIRQGLNCQNENSEDVFKVGIKLQGPVFH